MKKDILSILSIGTFVVWALVAVATFTRAQTPAAAVPFSPEAVQQFLFTTTQAKAAAVNAMAKDQYLRVTGPNWTANAMQTRALKRPIPAKPMPPLVLHVSMTKGWPQTTQSFYEATMGPDMVCDPVADLPAEPKPPTADAHIGIHLYGNFYQALDSVADGTEITGPDGARYVKHESPWGAAGANGHHEGVYEKLP